MKYCKKCATFNPDYTDNCPLCGAALATAEQAEPLFDGAPYPHKSYISPRALVRNIFIILSAIILISLTVASLLSKVWGIIYIGITAVGFTWLAVLQFVFFRTNLRSIYYRLAFWLAVLSALVSAHYGRIDIFSSYVLPCILFVLNVVTMMTVFISGKWYKFAFHAFVLAVVMVVMFPLNYLLQLYVDPRFNYIASIVVMFFGLVTIFFSFIFGRRVLKDEFKKRFFV